jgi:outer membrane protein OmpA-like peptidoglycan-associated protein
MKMVLTVPLCISVSACLSRRAGTLSAGLAEVIASVPNDGRCSELKVAMVQQIEAVEKKGGFGTQASATARIQTAKLTEAAILRAVLLRKACVDLSEHKLSNAEFDNRIAAIFYPEGVSLRPGALLELQSQLRELDQFLRGANPRAIPNTGSFPLVTDTSQTLQLSLAQLDERLSGLLKSFVDAIKGSGSTAATGEPTGGMPSGGTAPGGTAPGGTAPGGTAPGGTAPGGAAPGGAAPGGAAPGGASPGGAAPGGAAPGGTALGGANPGGTTVGPGAPGALGPSGPPYTVLDTFTVRFDVGADTLSGEAARVIAERVRLNSLRPVIVTLLGYASPEGPPSLNKSLSVRRGEFVRRLLIEDAGVLPALITTIPMGTTTRLGSLRRPDLNRAVVVGIYERRE